MGDQWSAERILSLAPDASSAKAGKDLASARRWQNLGRNDAAIWGECQGSGSKPYQTRIELAEPAFKCSCPSRKFPCKHALALFLLSVEKPDAVAAGAPPGWVQEWLQSRSDRAVKKAQKKEAASEEPVDPAAQAKRIASREKKITAGLEQLATWLGDVISKGLAAVQAEGQGPWDQMAARMVDAQAPGVARLLREAADAMSSGAGWQERLLMRLSRLHLLIEGYGRLASLPEPLAAEIRSLVGWTQATEDVLAGEGVQDTWCVVGQRVAIEDRLRVQRTWLWGINTRRPALLLQFAHGGAPFAATLIPGTAFDGMLAFYAGSYPLRALVKERNGTTRPISQIGGYATVAEMLAAYAQALAANPWIELFPAALEAVSVLRDGESWYLRDAQGLTLPIAPRFGRTWQMLAASGGHPVGVFGEWDGEYLLPLSLTAGQEFALLVRE